MFCYKCGTQLPDDAQFCTKCGTRMDNLNMHPNEQNESKTENSSDQSKHVLIQYNPYKKSFKYFYSNGIDTYPVNDNMMGKLNPLKWNNLEEIINILNNKDYQNNGILTVKFQGSDEDFDTLEKICHSIGYNASHDKSKTLASASSLYKELYNALESIKKELHDQDITSHIDTVLNRSRLSDDKPNACIDLGAALQYCAEELKKLSSQTITTPAKSELTLNKGSYDQLKNKKEYKWQDLKEIKAIKYDDPQKLLSYLSKLMIDDLKNDTFNYFAPRLSDGSTHAGQTNFIISLPPTLSGNISTESLRNRYQTAFDNQLSREINDYISDNLELGIRRKGTVRKINQAGKMSDVMKNIKEQYFDKFADIFLYCAKAEQDAIYHTPKNNQVDYDAKVKKYTSLYEAFQKKTNF